MMDIYQKSGYENVYDLSIYRRHQKRRWAPVDIRGLYYVEQTLSIEEEIRLHPQGRKGLEKTLEQILTNIRRQKTLLEKSIHSAEKFSD